MLASHLRFSRGIFGKSRPLLRNFCQKVERGKITKDFGKSSLADFLGPTSLPPGILVLSTCQFTSLETELIPNKTPVYLQNLDEDEPQIRVPRTVFVETYGCQMNSSDTEIG